MRTNQRGTALIFALMVTGLMILLATSLAILTRATTIVEVGHADTLQSFYGAEAGANRGNAEFRNILQGYNVPTSGDYVARSTTLGGNPVRYQLGLVTGYPKSDRIPAGQSYAGLNTIDYMYTTTSEALAADGATKAKVVARTLLHYIPIFQFAAFYNDDLEIQPKPNMTLHGRVHTNGSLYLNSSGNTLSIVDLQPVIPTVEVSAAASIYRKRKDDGNCAGTVTIDTLAADASGNLIPRNVACKSGGAALTSSDTSPWLGSLLSGVQTLTVPPVSATVRGATGAFDYWPKADLRIVLNMSKPASKEFGQTLLPLVASIVPAQPALTATQVNSNAPNLYPIEVQNLDGSRNVAATTILWKFMYANPGKIFYNDKPTSKTCYADCAKLGASYSTPFVSHTGTASDNNAMVYRRIVDAQWTNATTTGVNQRSNRLDYRRGAFFNNREKRAGGDAGGQGTFLYLLNIDVEALMTWNLAQPVAGRLFDPADRTEGGLVIFASIQGNEPTRYGVRVFDSPDLPFPGITNSADPTGLTIVSDEAIYVDGNYNCNDGSRCNLSTVTATWDPAAFIGDALNVLSQGWETTDVTISGKIYANDSKSLLPLADRPAADTEINAGFIAGQDLTVGSLGSGGLENYPRMHELWDEAADDFNYRGSFVSLGTPIYSSGPWCYNGQSCDITTGNCTGSGNCNIYTPPFRKWDYDARFETAANLPPLNPRVLLSKQDWFDEQFN